ncbi:MAG: hypothetical protein M4D80_35095 [Myxococcota bacterium]|nr:hypothetical protein [Myxococcota bacterium]
MALRPVLLAIALFACGGGAPTKANTTIEKPVEAVDPACPTGTTFKLPDGKFRCRELPLTIDFPANSEMERQDSENLTFIRATLDRGVLAIFAEPRFAIDGDIDGLKKRLAAVVKGIADDATIVDVAAPPEEGASASTGITFTTPDGGVGTMYGYLAHGWFVAVLAGGRLAETPARPDQPMGKAFLASLVLRKPVTGWETREVFSGIKLELPLAAWEVQEEPDLTGTVKTSKLFAAVDENVWIGARDLQQSAKCELFQGVTDADVPSIVKKMFGSEDLQVTGKLVKIGTQAISAQLVVPGKTMTLYLICDDPRVVLITVTGSRPIPELTTTIDRVTRAFKR